MRSLLRALPLLLAASLLPAGSAAQTPEEWDPARLQVARAELEDLLARYERVANSSGYSGGLREDARRRAQQIRQRLDEGDFRVGDRIWIEIRGEAELPDTVMVEPGPSITLLNMGSISLRGVLRSELKSHLEQEISRYIQEPEVRSQALIRMEMRGQVGNPGFHVFASDMLLSDAFMQAGGPGGNADMEDIKIERSGDTLYEPEEVTRALADGRSLDQLGLRAGDVMIVEEEEESRIWPVVLRWGAIVASSLLLGVRIF